MRQGSFIYYETKESRESHAEEFWGPEHVAFTFTAWLDCSYDKCKEKIAVTGSGGLEDEHNEYGPPEWNNNFYPRWIEPPLRIIEIPANCPVIVSDPLNDAFALYWSKPVACASRIRVALEALLNHLDIQESVINKEGKSTQLVLHSRIELFSKQNKVIGEQLMALKWLGNTGAHGSEVTKSDIIDGLELLEHCLLEVLDRRSSKMDALAKKLTDKHKPVHPSN